MATNKTIDITNVTVQIPAMADKPNQATNSNCLDKIIDGVNALNSKFKTSSKTGTTDSGGNINLSGSKLRVISAICEGYICIPFYNTNNVTYVKIFEFATMNPASNTSVVVEYVYYDG